MDTRRDRLDTIRSMLKALVGQCLTEYLPRKYSDMVSDEQEQLLEKHKGLIDKGVDAMETVLDAEMSASTGEILGRIKSSEGIDPDMIDQILEYSTGSGEYPIDEV